MKILLLNIIKRDRERENKINSLFLYLLPLQKKLYPGFAFDNRRAWNNWNEEPKISTLCVPLEVFFFFKTAFGFFFFKDINKLNSKSKQLTTTATKFKKASCGERGRRDTNKNKKPYSFSY